MADMMDKLDVRKIAPHKKHSTIFDAYDALEQGDAFMIINDHDPKPLGYQMAAVYGGEAFFWEYLEEGPDIWRVRIGKMDS